MSENNNTENSPILNAPERTVGNEPKTHVLAQEETYEQMKIYVAPLTRQLVHITGLIQEMSTAQQPISYPRACTGASFNAFSEKFFLENSWSFDGFQIWDLYIDEFVSRRLWTKELDYRNEFCFIFRRVLEELFKLPKLRS